MLRPDAYGDLVPTAVSPASLSAAYDSTRASTLSGTVQLSADTSGWSGLAPLAPISGSLAMNDPDVTSGPAPTVSTSSLDDVLSFAAVTPSDLLAGLQELSLFLHNAQTTTLSVNGGRTAGDIPLPFMLGKLSDTFDARAAIDRFIGNHGQAGPAGLPDFHSIQGMLTELNAADAGNTTVSVDNLTWTDATKKLSYGLHVHSSQSNVPLDPNEGAQEDPHIGQVDFGKALVPDAGIDSLAAQHATATGSPAYQLDVTPVLDLSSSSTGQPTSMLRTGGSLLTADVPVSTGVDAGGTAGSVNLHAGGQLKVNPPSGGHMLALSLNPTGDAEGDARVSALLSQLGRAPSSVLAAVNGGSATADLGLDVPGTGDFFTGTNCTNEAVAGCSDASVKQTDISDPSTISVSGSELGTLKAFNLGPDRSREMLTKVQSSLLTLADSVEKLPTLTQGTAGQVLGSPIPLLGTSVGQLIDAKALRTAIASLNGKSPATLKDLADALNAALGSGSSIAFSTGTGSGGQPLLLAHLVQHEQVDRNVPLDLSRGPGEPGLIGVSSSGNLHLTGSVDIDVTVAVDVGAAAGADSSATLLVMPGSKVVAQLKVDGGGTISGTFGPYQAQLGDANDPSVVHVAVDLELSDPSPGLDAIPFSQWAGGLGVSLNHNSSPVHCTSADANLTLDVCAALPLYLSHDGGQTYKKVSETGNNNFNVRLPADDASFDVLGDPIPDPSGGSHDRLESPDGLAAALAGALLDFSTLKWGADQFFGLVENGLQAAAGGGGLPIVGSDLEEGHRFVEDLQGQVDAAFNALPPLEGLSSGALAQTIEDRLTQGLGSTLRNQVQVTLTCSAGPCSGSEPATQVVKAAVQFDVGSASSDLSRCEDPSAGCLGFSTPLNLGLPGLSLTGDNLSGGVGWSLHVAFGLDKSGFFAEPGNQLKLGLGLRAPQNLSATLGFLHVHVSDLSGGTKPTFAGTASVGLTNAQDSYISDLVNLGPSVIDANLSAQADADWHVEATADSALPGIAADFHLHWSLTNPDSTPSLIRFDNIGVVPGSIVQGALGPIARTLYNLMSPVRPILNALNDPIPVLDWLAEHAGLQPPTVLSLLGVAGDASNDQRVTMIHRAAVIASIVNNITSATANNQPIPLRRVRRRSNRRRHRAGSVHGNEERPGRPPGERLGLQVDAAQRGLPGQRGCRPAERLP